MAGIDLVEVTSGGQMSVSAAIAAGGVLVDARRRRYRVNGRIVRTGSNRHDDGRAADLNLQIDGRKLNFTTTSGRRVVEKFLEYCTSFGANGIGAADNYMGPVTMHVGFGGAAAWGAGGNSANAPAWLRQAWNRGMNTPQTLPPQSTPDMMGSGRFMVTARNGLNLRGGPSTNFPVIGGLPFDQEVEVLSRSGDWAKIDILFDGIADGYVHGAFLKKAF
ncbi:MAG: SH3 domain-containing protein [Devosia sp.]